LGLGFVCIGIFSVHTAVFFLEEMTSKACMGFMLKLGCLIKLIEGGLDSLVSFGRAKAAESGVRLWLDMILFKDRFCGVSLNFGD
jgi:hypothetical protein